MDSNQRAVEVNCVDISLSFGGSKRVLDSLNLKVPGGKIVSLLGASGCGKSSLLRIVAGLQEPTKGRVEIGASTDSVGLKAIGPKRAFVFQEATLMPWRTVWENVRLPLDLDGTASVASSKERIASALTEVGLAQEDYSKFPAQLSGGMRMRVSMARALVTEPNLLLLDEPFAALDDMLRTRLNELLISLWCQHPRTVLFVTHNIAESIFLSHHIAIMSGGSIAHWMDIPQPFPRERQWRSTASFAELYGEVANRLSEVTR